MAKSQTRASKSKKAAPTPKRYLSPDVRNAILSELADQQVLALTEDYDAACEYVLRGFYGLANLPDDELVERYEYSGADDELLKRCEDEQAKAHVSALIDDGIKTTGETP